MYTQNKIVYIVGIFIAIFAVVVALYSFDSLKKSPISELPITTELEKRYFSELYPIIDDCSEDIPLSLIDDNSIDQENGVIEVYWFDADKQENTKRTFLYRPGANSEKCSASVKSKLDQAYKSEQETVQEYRKQCEEYKATLRGEIPLPEKGGVKPSMQGIIMFIEQYCQ